MKKEIIEWIKSLLLALVLGFIITSFVRGTRVYGSSMVPTLRHKDFLIVLNIKNIERGDIVVVKTDLEMEPKDLSDLNFINKWNIGKTKFLVKRVIAVEGDSLTINDGKVFLNGQELKEQYINGNETFGNIAIDEIPEGKIFVMGDNRGNSLDSRDERLGLVDIKDISGKVIFRVFPFSKIGTLK